MVKENNEEIGEKIIFICFHSVVFSLKASLGNQTFCECKMQSFQGECKSFERERKGKFISPCPFRVSICATSENLTPLIEQTILISFSCYVYNYFLILLVLVSLSLSFSCRKVIWQCDISSSCAGRLIVKSQTLRRPFSTCWHKCRSGRGSVAMVALQFTACKFHTALLPNANRRAITLHCVDYTIQVSFAPVLLLFLWPPNSENLLKVLNLRLLFHVFIFSSVFDFLHVSVV